MHKAEPYATLVESLAGPLFRMKPVIFGLFLLASGLGAQDRHVAWKLSVEPAAAPPGGKVLVRMAGHIDEGWHLYSMSTPAAFPPGVKRAPTPATAALGASLTLV